MWELSDKYEVFMLLWVILAAVANSGFSIVFGLFGFVYAILAFYHNMKEIYKK